MADYRRYRVPGGTCFFTINLLERRSDLLVRHIDALREAVRRTRRERPFRIDAWVVLPDHMHCIITLPEDDDDFSNRIKAIKIRFFRAIPATELSPRQQTGRREGLDLGQNGPCARCGGSERGPQDTLRLGTRFSARWSAATSPLRNAISNVPSGWRAP